MTTLTKPQTSLRTIIFHPATVFAVALASAAIFAIVSYTAFDGDLRDLLVYYFAPIGVPFVAFLFERAERWPDAPWLIDLPLVMVSFARAVYPIPFISGHALFLSYAILTTRTRVTRWTAVIVLIQVAYVKIFVWHDPTLFGGIVLGMVAAWVVGKYREPVPQRI
ncbi:MAG: hypothetical protein K8I30_14585 [Anaerolineae bacterium]|nr:hypothetical protein [Anaerolineae bacterium]